ncbi:MAG: hypothetical protein M1822_001631 [Bathelium mastoideum]|nr:MAG: hypothetical protein M1822_001631 [Bathelium mastoideum]
MAENIRIPSPSAFLQSPTSPGLETSATDSAPPSLPVSGKERSSAGNPKEGTIATGASKRKQTKSRNGCATCKKKRLKCDEGKPECQQCIKRRVPCGGYAKDFKWRTFDEPQLAQKTATAHSKKASFSNSSLPNTLKSAHKEPLGSDPSCGLDSIRIEQHQNVPANESNNGRASQRHCPLKKSVSTPLVHDSRESSSTVSFVENHDQDTCLLEPQSTSADTTGETNHTGPSRDSSAEELLEGDRSSWLDFGLDMGSAFLLTALPQDGPDACSLDFLGSDGDRPLPHSGLNDANGQNYVAATTSLLPTSPIGGIDGIQDTATVSLKMMLRQPQVNVGCPDVLFTRFDRETCGILSVKDGPTENGWRTLILPMARNCRPLYHALAALTSFHLVKQFPSLHKQGIEHVQASLNGLRSELQRMRVDAAVATSLVLAFAESWDKNITTGIDHIKGANHMLRRALTIHQKKPLEGCELQRLRFLCSTWVYMDVIARLTSTSSADNTEFDEICQLFSFSCSMHFRTSPLCSPTLPIPADPSVDALMGCAASLFPVIGHTANLVRRVWRAPVNNAPIIATATELKQQLESWAPPPAAVFAAPEDQQTSIADCLRTAEAYRAATLLHLFQAVPEIASQPKVQLAHQALNLLAMVPLASRAVIVHIYPLLAAGCEMVDTEMREWVCDRWARMGRRMGIGIIEASVRVVEEVWRRRDTYEGRVGGGETEDLPSSGNADGEDGLPLQFRPEWNGMEEDIQAADDFSDLTAGMSLNEGVSLDSVIMTVQPKRKMVGDMDFEYTVKGSLHWLGVMKGWEWEVLLG